MSLTPRQTLGFRLSLSLTVARGLMALPLAEIALTRGSARAVAAILVLGLLSDYYDGVIARHFDVATAGLRRLDSATDTLFFAAVAVCVWRLHPNAITGNRWLLSIVVGTLLLNHVVELVKFGKEAAYHAWSAKAWGLALFVALTVLFATDNARLIPIALAVGVISHLENLCITLALPRWQHDVRSLRYALALRRSTPAE
jgi:CDP-diacylglycerol--glycerol-3-phosphate 3-phosphatidyltransferase